MTARIIGIISLLSSKLTWELRESEGLGPIRRAICTSLVSPPLPTISSCLGIGEEPFDGNRNGLPTKHDAQTAAATNRIGVMHG